MAWLQYTPATQPNTIAGVHTIVSQQNGIAIDNGGLFTYPNGALEGVSQWGLNYGQNQECNFIPTSNGYYQIKKAYSALDLNVAGASTANGAKIVQWQFGSQGNDQWLPVRNADGSYVFYNRNSGSLLDSPGVTTQTKTVQLDQWSANGGGSNQRFNVIGR